MITCLASLIDAVKDHSITGVGGQSISAAAAAVAAALSDLIASARLLPGGAGLKLEDTGEEIEHAASKELGTAAKLIEEAAAALVAARPPPKPQPKGIVFDTTDVTGKNHLIQVSLLNRKQTLIGKLLFLTFL